MDAETVAGEARLHRAVRALATQTGAPVDKMIDWLCNGGLANMMLVYATAKPPVVVGPEAEQIPEPARPKLTPVSAHPALAAANEWAELTAEWDQLPFGTRAYYDGLAKCDAAWERLAAAVGVLASSNPDAWARTQWPEHQLRDNGADTPLMALVRKVWTAAAGVGLVDGRTPTPTDADDGEQSHD